VRRWKGIQKTKTLFPLFISSHIFWFFDSTIRCLFSLSFSFIFYLSFPPSSSLLFFSFSPPIHSSLKKRLVVVRKENKKVKNYGGSPKKTSKKKRGKGLKECWFSWDPIFNKTILFLGHFHSSKKQNKEVTLKE